MFYDFIDLAKEFRMRPKVWSTLINNFYYSSATDDLQYRYFVITGVLISPLHQQILSLWSLIHIKVYQNAVLEIGDRFPYPG